MSALQQAQVDAFLPVSTVAPRLIGL